MMNNFEEAWHKSQKAVKMNKWYRFVTGEDGYEHKTVNYVLGLIAKRMNKWGYIDETLGEFLGKLDFEIVEETWRQGGDDNPLEKIIEVQMDEWTAEAERRQEDHEWRSGCGW